MSRQRPTRSRKQIPAAAKQAGAVQAEISTDNLAESATDGSSRTALLRKTLPALFIVLIAFIAPPAAAKQEAAAPAEAPTVEIPPDKQQLMGVKTIVVAPRQIGKTIRTVGRVEYDEPKLATVGMKFEGWIEKLYADYTGKQVRKGDPLADVYSPELLATQQELLNTLRWARTSGEAKEGSVGSMLNRDAGAIIEAARQRLRLWDVSDEQIKAIEETGRTVRALTVHSPADGTVVQKAAIQGMRVMVGYSEWRSRLHISTACPAR